MAMLIFLYFLVPIIMASIVDYTLTVQLAWKTVQGREKVCHESFSTLWDRILPNSFLTSVLHLHRCLIEVGHRLCQQLCDCGPIDTCSSRRYCTSQCVQSTIY